MSSATRQTGDVGIRWEVTGPDGTLIWGIVSIDRQHAEDMNPGKPPNDFMQYGAERDWMMRNEKANKMAAMIASQIAADILSACDPDKRRDIAASQRR